MFALIVSKFSGTGPGLAEPLSLRGAKRRFVDLMGAAGIRRCNRMHRKSRLGRIDPPQSHDLFSAR
jgi:hypothetical protein